MEIVQTTVTRKFQVTIPKKIRKRLGVRIGDRYKIKNEGDRIVIETGKHISNPAEYIWNLSKKPIDTDAVKLIKISREKKAK
jgi:AbrB family looped-hinge helix DNA binding protein